MATTTLLQRHAGEGETIAEAIRDCLDYGKDPEKTESGKYISAYECDPATVADEFLLAKASYAAMTGREQKKENNVLCYQIRQSFYPGEITPKEANRIGYELAMRWTKGRHAFIVTTHTDKQHIHCHIYYNSTTLDCTRKFRNFWGSSFALRRLSDRLCLENGLSIVENPKPRSKGKYRNYGEWQKDRKGPLSYQDRLRLAIDTALAERPADLDEFLNLMKRAGYEVKTVRGGGISFRAPGAFFFALNGGQNILQVVAVPQRGGSQTGKAFLSLPGQPETDTAAPNRLDLISGPLHQIEKFVQISGAFRQRSINGKAQSVLIGKRPFPVFLPLPIVPILALAPGLRVLHDGQPVFKAQPVGEPTESKAGTPEVSEFPGTVN